MLPGGQEQIVSEKVISEDQVEAECFNKLFINIRSNLKIPTNRNYDTNFIITNDRVINAINKFRNHRTVVMIKDERKIDQCFSFDTVTDDFILK